MEVQDQAKPRDYEHGCVSSLISSHEKREDHRAQLLDKRRSGWTDESGLESTTKLIHMHKMVVDGSLNHQEGMKCRTRVGASRDPAVLERQIYLGRK